MQPMQETHPYMTFRLSLGLSLTVCFHGWEVSLVVTNDRFSVKKTQMPLKFVTPRKEQGSISSKALQQSTLWEILCFLPDLEKCNGSENVTFCGQLQANSPPNDTMFQI